MITQLQLINIIIIFIYIVDDYSPSFMHISLTAVVTE